MMFWEKGYTPSQNIEALLQKEDVTVEDLLDDDDILQECKTPKKNLILFFTRPDVIKRLIQLITTEPPEDLPLAQRFKHANMACEVLTSGLPSLNEKLVEDPEILQALYSYLEQEPPLNPLIASFFSKTFCMLTWRKYDQDWFLYQKMCLQVLEFIKLKGNFLELIFKHFATPVIMDLLLQIIKEVRGGSLIQNFYEWLTEQQLVERLINMLGEQEESEKHNNIAEFICDLIIHGRSIRQKEHETDSFGPGTAGNDPILQTIESEKTIALLLDVMLRPPIQESSIVAGTSIVLTLIDQSIVDEPASDKALIVIKDKEKFHQSRVFITVMLEVVARIEQFHEILNNPPPKNDIITPVTHLSPPFGATRLQICRLLSALMRDGRYDICYAFCKNGLVNTSLNLFKQYCWNNFLHSEVQKCICGLFLAFGKPTYVQKMAIVKCKICSLLIDCWMHNREVQSTTGRRLGYMGHLIKIFEVLATDPLGALIESNLSEDELENWKLITDKENGELFVELNLQKKELANCNAYESAEPGLNLPKEFQFNSQLSRMEVNDLQKIWEEFDEATNNLGEFFFQIENSNVNSQDPWGELVTVSKDSPSGDNSSGWNNFAMDDFADFDTYFSSFTNDLGSALGSSDTNANVQKNYYCSPLHDAVLQNEETSPTDDDDDDHDQKINDNTNVDSTVEYSQSEDTENNSLEDANKGLCSKISFVDINKGAAGDCKNEVVAESITNGPMPDSSQQISENCIESSTSNCGSTMLVEETNAVDSKPLDSVGETTSPSVAEEPATTTENSCSSEASTTVEGGPD